MHQEPLACRCDKAFFGLSCHSEGEKIIGVTDSNEFCDKMRRHSTGHTSSLQPQYVGSQHAHTSAWSNNEDCMVQSSSHASFRPSSGYLDRPQADMSQGPGRHNQVEPRFLNHRVGQAPGGAQTNVSACLLIICAIFDQEFLHYLSETMDSNRSPLLVPGRFATSSSHNPSMDSAQ